MSKIDNIVKKSQKIKLDTLGDFAGIITARLANDELPWQIGNQVARMPVTLMGKPISNINYLSLVSPSGDHRWGRFDEYKAQGASVLKGSKAAHGIFWIKVKAKQAQADDAENVSLAGANAPAAEKFLRRPMAVRYFNMAQTDIESAAVNEIDFRDSLMQIEDIAVNAGITFAKKSAAIGDTTYDGNVVFADTHHMTPEAVGEAIYGIVDWSMDDDKPFAIKSSSEVRSQFVRAIAGSMLCSEYGVPVPDAIQNEMAGYKQQFLEFAEANQEEVFRVARDAWDIRAFVHQYAPTVTNDDTSEADALEASRESSQPNNLFGA